MSRRLVDGLEQRARELLPAPVFDYVHQGSRDGVTAAEAVAAWDRFRFLPHVMRDVTSVSTGTTLLGTPVASPLAIGPTTMQRALHPDGEVAMARAAAAAGTLMVLSSNAGSTFADVAATGVHWWLQLYVTSARESCVPLLEQAVAAGAAGVVVTADTPVVGTKYDAGDQTVWDLAQPGWVRANFGRTGTGTVGDEKATDLGPQDVEWLASLTGLPIVVKGVLRPQDARRCVDAGAGAVWVSNHGGRQLDHAAATPDCLAAVVDAVDGSAEVYVDGGVRHGHAALTALALGARGVFLGRLPLYALAAGGPDAVRAMLAELGEELVEALTLAGCPSVDRVPRDLLV
jgi:4-hydroxymandelate oxidase